MRRTLYSITSALLVLLFVFATACGGGGGGPAGDNTNNQPPGNGNPDGAGATVVEPDGTERDVRIASEDPQVPEEAADSPAAEKVFTASPVSPLETDEAVIASSVSETERKVEIDRSASSISANDRVVLQDSINETAADLASVYDHRAGNGFDVYPYWTSGGGHGDNHYFGWTWFRDGSNNADNLGGVTARGLLYATHFDPAANSGSGFSPANVAQDIYTSGTGPIGTDHPGYLGKGIESLSEDRPFCQDVVYQVEYANLAQDPSEFGEAQRVIGIMIDQYREPAANFGSTSPDGDAWDVADDPSNSDAEAAQNLVERLVEIRGGLAGWDLAACAEAAALTGNQEFAEETLDLVFGDREFGSGPDGGWRDIASFEYAETMSLGALLWTASRVNFDRYSDPLGNYTGEGGPLKAYATELVQDRQERSYGYFGVTENLDGDFDEGEFIFDDLQAHAHALVGLSGYLKARAASGIDGGDPGSTTAQLEIGVDKAQEWLEFFARNDDGTYPTHVIGNTDTTELSDLNNETIGEALWAASVAAENKDRFPLF